ncbi:alpha/beta hydrolase [Achromobacter sp.]|uniref:alpha/beta hydrolase n=1 Tax=Achromobacter sp. TaxID=134375 RepID=UPI0028AD5E4E|nr:alpha/beta hydrolase [Achromobacter sp.]
MRAFRPSIALLLAALCCQAAAAPLMDQPYGPDAAQLADVHLPDTTDATAESGSPILVVVHGGSWKGGDKAASDVVDDKLAYWLPKGFIVVSVNTRLLPAARPEQQAEDLGSALAWIGRQAATWNADPNQIIVMGHSSGGHLATLLAADTSMQQRTGAQPWLASIILDGAGFDLLDTLPKPHAAFYDEAFGTDPKQWAAASPAAQLRGKQPPTLFVCSTLRPDPCNRARRYAALIQAHGSVAELAGVARNHAQINADVGEDNEETRTIAAFIDARLAR